MTLVRKDEARNEGYTPAYPSPSDPSPVIVNRKQRSEDGKGYQAAVRYDELPVDIEKIYTDLGVTQDDSVDTFLSYYEGKVLERIAEDTGANPGNLRLVDSSECLLYLLYPGFTKYYYKPGVKVLGLLK